MPGLLGRDDMSIFDRLANPGRFQRTAQKLMPLCLLTSCLSFVVGLYYALIISPADYQQGESVRIMYIHVPAAWLALSSYLGLGACALLYLIWRHPLADIAARAVAPIGCGFAALTLITGSLWGYPTWGTWWVWDARLTSTLILFFFFLGHIALASGFDRPERGARPAAILALVGCVNLPIVKFSVDWWNTLHQPATISKLSKPSIDPSMMIPLIIMTFAFIMVGLAIAILRIKTEIISRKTNLI